MEWWGFRLGVGFGEGEGWRGGVNMGMVVTFSLFIEV